MVANEIALSGCTSTPLANYLKALGVLRLISNPMSNVDGIAADLQAKGFWDRGHFNLQTRLDQDGLTRFFIENYAPSPIIAPWNGGSGFYPGDKKDGIDPFTGTNVASRFRLISNAVQAAFQEINLLGFNPQLQLIVGGHVRLADCWSYTKKQLEFRYKVSKDDTRTNDVRIDCDGLRPNRAEITGKSGKKRLSSPDGSEEEALEVSGSEITSTPRNGHEYETGEFILANVYFSENVKVEAKPNKDNKPGFVSRLRGNLPDPALTWLDATLAIAGDKLSFPQLLGTGGNDGRLDFTNNFMQRLATALFDIVTGHPSDKAERLLETALFGDGVWGFHKVAIGQFAPSASGGPNASTGFKSGANVNPWDFVLALEGAIMFAGSATRRHQSLTELGASFPFTVRPTGAGWGGLADTDEGNARAEFWAPIWKRPTGAVELEGLLREGRAVLNGKTARDGLDFARAVSSLGISRGISAFERYGFVMRAGLTYLAAPLGERKVSFSSTEGVELISELDIGGWLNRVRRLARKEGAPARARTIVRRLEDALFEMSGVRASSRSVQGVLDTLGELVWWLKDSKDAFERSTPPPRLSYKWIRMADDKSPEFRIAAALASLGWSRQDSTSDNEESSIRNGRSAERTALAAHFAPIANETIFRRQRKWNAQNSARVVWNTGSLDSNLIAVLQRRLGDASIDHPLEAEAPARLSDIIMFLGGDFDDTRCASLLAGLVWAQPASRLPATSQGNTVLPLSYAAIKTIYTPASNLKAMADKGLIPADCTIPTPPGLVASLRSGRVTEAVRIAHSRARASGISCPFANSLISSNTISGIRLAAALLIPLDISDLQLLIERVFASEKEN